MSSEVLPLIEEGADELYCGYLPAEWEKKYTNLEFERKGGSSNFTNINELRLAIKLAHRKNVPVFVALNGLYISEQYRMLLDIINSLNRIGIDGYIVADLGLLLTLKGLGFNKEIHISTGGAVFNQEAVDFYNRLGAKRIILDRQTSLETIDALSSYYPRMEFEVFILNTLCVYIDGLCTFMHSPLDMAKDRHSMAGRSTNVYTTYDINAYKEACSLKYSVKSCDISGRGLQQAKKIAPVFHKPLTDGVECNACSLYYLNKMNIKAAKIVGRQLSAQARLKSIRFIRAVLDILDSNKGISKRDFMLKTKRLYRNSFNYHKLCEGNNCYHPEVLRYGKGHFNQQS
ncbi:MAG: U32 family peptidase [Candidatus Omnitrophota bacterium]